MINSERNLLERKGTMIFEGRMNTITGEVEYASQCQKCGDIKWSKKPIQKKDFEVTEQDIAFIKEYVKRVKT